MRTKIHFNGQEVDAELVEVVNATERWGEYMLEDGTTLRLKVILAGVYRIDGQFDSVGNPLYVVQSQNVTSVNSPQELKRK